MSGIAERRINGIYICFGDISEADASCTDGFSEYRLKKLSSIRNEDEKRRSAGAEHMLIHAASVLFPHLPLPVRYEADELGKPYFTAPEGFFLSLSHSGTLAACAVSDTPVGIDVQLERTPGAGLLRRCFTERERGAALGDPAVFTRLWARKEAVSKAAGLGIQIGFGSLDVLEGQTEHRGRLYSVDDVVCGFAGYHMAVSRQL